MHRQAQPEQRDEDRVPPEEVGNAVRASLPNGASYSFAAGYTRHRYTLVITPTSPDTLTMAVGDSVALGLRVTDETGAPYPAPAPIWFTSNANVIDVSFLVTTTTTVVHAKAPGTVTISARNRFSGGPDDPTFYADKVIVVH